MAHATEDEISDLLGDRTDDAIVERIANLDVTVDEVSEAIDDHDHEARFGEARVAASPKIAEIRAILEELPTEENVLGANDHEDEHEGLTIMEPEELGREL